MTNDAAIHRREPAVMAHTHGTRLMVDAFLLALKTHSLSSIQAAGLDAVGDASLLVELALADGLIVRRPARGFVQW